MNDYFTDDLTKVRASEFVAFDMSEIKPLTVYPKTINSGAAIYPATIVEGPINNSGAAVVQSSIDQGSYPTTVSGNASLITVHDDTVISQEVLAYADNTNLVTADSHSGSDVLVGIPVDDKTVMSTNGSNSTYVKIISFIRRNFLTLALLAATFTHIFIPTISINHKIDVHDNSLIKININYCEAH